VQLRELADTISYTIIYDDRRQLVNVHSGESPPDIRREPVLFPILIENSADRNTITRTYMVGEHENAAEILTDDFVENGITYVLTGMTKEENPIMDGRIQQEVVQVEVSTDDIAAVLAALGDIFHYEDEFGFQGELQLRADTVRVEAAGHRNEGFTSRQSRSYPHLSSRDVALVPRTIQVNGRTYTLEDVQWTESRHDVVDYRSLGASFTANATYVRQGTRRITTGFLATAEFVGEVNQFDWNMTRYVLTFEAVSGNHPAIRSVESTSEPIREEAPTATPDPEPAKEPFPWGRIFSFIGYGLLIITGIGGVGFAGYLPAKRFLGKNITIYQVFGDGNYKLLTKAKLTKDMDYLDMTLLPEKIQDKITESKFIIALSNHARRKFEGKVIAVRLRGKTVSQYIDPEDPMRKYQFDVDFDKKGKEGEKGE
ncbi:MAG: hypothetical protein FWC91_12290, partial [Defluviitaleaceae bacterium]|nr:hypothetical protein [Defluviitaleaceae bacterium]